MNQTVIFWIIFNAFIIVLLIIDLNFLHRKDETADLKTSLKMNAFWILLALLFNIGIYYFRGFEDSINFFTAYVLEYTLSIDNLFVFFLIFSHFNIPEKYLHKVLFWGVLGAIILRALFIIGGIALIHKFYWIFYFFGAFLIYGGIRFLLPQEKKVDLEKNSVLKFFQRFFPYTHEINSADFFVLKHNKYWATPLFFTLILVDFTDLIFALDSIPAVLGITTDITIAYTSNIFAVLGLRSLYFTLSHLIGYFQYLNYGLGAILIFVGFKMLTQDFIHIPHFAALSFIIFTLLIAVSVSIIKKKGL